MKMRSKTITPYLLFALIAAILPAFFSSQYIAGVGTMVFLFAFWALAWDFIGGYTGQMALGNGIYIGIGAFFTGAFFKYLNISPWVGIIMAGLICAVVATAIAFPIFRLHGTYFAISTTAMLYVLRLVWQENRYILGFDMGGTTGLKLPWYGGFMSMQFLDKTVYYYISLIFLIGLMVITYFVENSKTGYYFQAIRSNQDAAASMGIHVQKYKAMAQFMSAFFLGMGGGIYAMFMQYVDPNRAMGYDMALQVVLYAVIGGRASVWGPVLATVILYPINELIRSTLASQYAGISTLFYGVALMIVIYFLPGGIVTYFHKLYENIWAKLSGKKKTSPVKTEKEGRADE